jgi:hypothetical protein
MFYRQSEGGNLSVFNGAGHSPLSLLAPRQTSRAESVSVPGRALPSLHTKPGKRNASRARRQVPMAVRRAPPLEETPRYLRECTPSPSNTVARNGLEPISYRGASHSDPTAASSSSLKTSASLARGREALAESRRAWASDEITKKGGVHRRGRRSNPQAFLPQLAGSPGSPSVFSF